MTMQTKFTSSSTMTSGVAYIEMIMQTKFSGNKKYYDENVMKHINFIYNLQCFQVTLETIPEHFFNLNIRHVSTKVI